MKTMTVWILCLSLLTWMTSVSMAYANCFYKIKVRGRIAHSITPKDIQGHVTRHDIFLFYLKKKNHTKKELSNTIVKCKDVNQAGMTLKGAPNVKLVGLRRHLPDGEYKLTIYVWSRFEQKPFMLGNHGGDLGPWIQMTAQKVIWRQLFGFNSIRIRRPGRQFQHCSYGSVFTYTPESSVEPPISVNLDKCLKGL